MAVTRKNGLLMFLVFRAAGTSPRISLLLSDLCTFRSFDRRGPVSRVVGVTVVDLRDTSCRVFKLDPRPGIFKSRLLQDSPE